MRSPETYVGYERSENFASMPKTVRDQAETYSAPARPGLNEWGLEGRWVVGAERATLAGAAGRLVYRFQARDLHLVLGPGPDGRPVRFRVRIDGQPPGSSHRVDVAQDGNLVGKRGHRHLRGEHQGRRARRQPFS